MHSSTDSNSIDLEKSILRREKLRAINEYPYKKSYSEKISTLIMSHPLYSSASVILAFSPLKSEVDITPILSDDRILLPYIDGNEIRFAKKCNLEKSPLGFLEPQTKTEYDYADALMLVPLIACDENLYRLGRGGGFYDRYIRRNRYRIHTIGVCFPVSFTEHVPITEADERLDEIPLL